MFKIKNFTALKDNAPDIPVNDILPLSRRTMVLLFRNQNKQIVEKNLFNIYGSVDMIGGLEYHHGKFHDGSRRAFKYFHSFGG